ncbi:MAG TPA: AMP-binding protein [Elusimicrobiales bacterium]|nr:AMP-binding protein [Elusimicrobiales bacterium]
MPDLKTLYSALIQTASNEPERTALASPKATLSYHSFLMDVDRAVDMLWFLGVRKNDKVAIALRNSPEFIITCLALSKIGAIAVPINFLISKTDELEFILSHSGSKGVVTQKEFLAPYKKLKGKIDSLEFIISVDALPDADLNNDVLNFRKLLKKTSYNPEAHNQHVLETDIVGIFYTSGTTGNPKGVMLTNGNIISNALSCISALNLTADDVFLCILPMFHTFSFTSTVILPILLGSKIVLTSHIAPAAPWLNMMGREKVTVVAGVPQLFGVLSKEAKGLKKYFLQYWAFRKVRLCMSGAAPLPESVVTNFEKKIRVPLLEGYGLTETSPVVTINKLGARKIGSVGKTISNAQVKIIDEKLNTLNCNQEGEICVKGVCVTQGYFKDKKSTEESFTPDGWFKTGDIGMLDDNGYLRICDRKKDMIINKGLKVFPLQVESVFLKHRSVEECAVIGVPHKDGEELIKCFCVLNKDFPTDKSDLMKFAREHLDAYKRPREIEIIDFLPKNALNKVLKRHLRQKHMEQVEKKRRSHDNAVVAGKL